MLEKITTVFFNLVCGSSWMHKEDALIGRRPSKLKIAWSRAMPRDPHGRRDELAAIKSFTPLSHHLLTTQTVTPTTPFSEGWINPKEWKYTSSGALDLLLEESMVSPLSSILRLSSQPTTMPFTFLSSRSS